MFCNLAGCLVRVLKHSDRDIKYVLDLVSQVGCLARLHGELPSDHGTLANTKSKYSHHREFKIRADKCSAVFGTKGRTRGHTNKCWRWWCSSRRSWRRRRGEEGAAHLKGTVHGAALAPRSRGGALYGHQMRAQERPLMWSFWVGGVGTDAVSMQHAAERKALLEEVHQGIRELLLSTEATSTRPLLSRYERPSTLRSEQQDPR